MDREGMERGERARLHTRERKQRKERCDSVKERLADRKRRRGRLFFPPSPLPLALKNETTL